MYSTNYVSMKIKPFTVSLYFSLITNRFLVYLHFKFDKMGQKEIQLTRNDNKKGLSRSRFSSKLEYTCWLPCHCHPLFLHCCDFKLNWRAWLTRSTLWHPWGWVLPYLDMVGRFHGDDPHFWDFQSDWVPILYLNTIRLTSYCKKKSVCLYHI